MKAEFERGNLKHDYRHAHVAWEIGERRYLAAVVGSFRDTDGRWFFETRHFCGDAAPSVPAEAVEILEIDYPESA